jgi:hypothetical protein
MFRLKPDPTFKTLVPLSRPGVEKPIDVPFEFRHKTKEEVATWMAGMLGRTDADVLDEVIVSWGVVDEGGRAVPYSHTALVGLLSDFPTSKGEIFSKYLSELTKAKEKNS